VGSALVPEDVKSVCGQPQADDMYKLTHAAGDRRVELQFYDMNHRMYLSNVKWYSNTGAGEIRQVTRDSINDYVKRGWLPACIGDAAR
jgi:hypothetical protein